MGFDVAAATVLVSKLPEGITIITINRPSAANSVNKATSLLLAEAFTSFDQDDSQKVCVLTGTENHFCAGYDLLEVASKPGQQPEAKPVDGVNRALGPMGPTRMRLSKPIIAAISGHAVAGGLELALLADIRVVDTTAVFGVFCRRFGVPLIDGGTVRLQRIVGFGRAMDMILTGRPIDAEEALSFGLANRVVEKGTALNAALDLARGLLDFPQKCMQGDLSSVYHAAYDADSLSDALRFEFEVGSRVIQEESVQGATRFAKGEGRSGIFKKAKL